MLTTVAAILANPRYTGHQVWNQAPDCRVDLQTLSVTVGVRYPSMKIMSGAAVKSRHARSLTVSTQAGSGARAAIQSSGTSRPATAVIPAARRSRDATSLSGVLAATAAIDSVSTIPRTLSAAAAATATAPAAASGCAWVTTADRAACATTRSRSSQNHAPSGAPSWGVPSVRNRDQAGATREERLRRRSSHRSERQGPPGPCAR